MNLPSTSDETSSSAAATPLPIIEANPHTPPQTQPKPQPLGDASAGVDLLVIGPHPDDVELTASGLLLKAKQLGYRTGAIELTQGEMGTRGTVEKRMRELEQAAEILGLDYRTNLCMPDGGVRADPPAIEAVVREIRKLDPAVVVIPPKHDDDHPDHWHGSRLCWEACHFARKIKYLPEVPVATRLNQVLMSMYRRWAPPQFVVDVTDVMDECIRAISVFSTQFGHDPDDKDAPETFISNPAFLGWWKGRRAFLGGMIGVQYGEGYFIEGPLRLDNPLGLFMPRTPEAGS